LAPAPRSTQHRLCSQCLHQPLHKQQSTVLNVISTILRVPTTP
jgi:hypothetical protein